jgi:hypothetical protein
MATKDRHVIWGRLMEPTVRAHGNDSSKPDARSDRRRQAVEHSVQKFLRRRRIPGGKQP